jgi:hypothetical protein
MRACVRVYPCVPMCMRACVRARVSVSVPASVVCAYTLCVNVRYGRARVPRLVDILRSTVLLRGWLPAALRAKGGL